MHYSVNAEARKFRVETFQFNIGITITKMWGLRIFCHLKRLTVQRFAHPYSPSQKATRWKIQRYLWPTGHSVDVHGTASSQDISRSYLLLLVALCVVVSCRYPAIK